MSYVAPSTTISLYKNVPLDSSYTHTTHYQTPAAQTLDFLNYHYKGFVKQSYQRWGLGTIKLEAKYDDLYGVNYMSFWNSTASKTIYCFVTGISYISENVTALFYTIDVMQTYMFDYEFRKCFVKRKHTATDVQGTNTQPEGLELGCAYKNESANIDLTFGNWHYIILATAFPSGQPFSTPTIVNGILCGLYIYDTADSSTATSILKAYIEAGLEDSIVSLYMGPPNENVAAFKSVTFSRNKIGNYTPRNKKLLSYPFCYAEITNNLGASLELHYEHMGTLSVVDGVAKRVLNYHLNKYNYPQPICVFSPQYLGSTDSNRDYELQYSVFPTCAFSGDSFKVWWAQNKNSYLASLNTIQTNYDTNISVNNSNFQQAYNSAQAQKQSVQNTNASALTSAEMNRNNAYSQAGNSKAISTNTLGNKLSNMISGGLDIMGNNIAGKGTVADSAINAVQNATGINQTTLQNTLNSGNVNAEMAYNNAIMNADLAYSLTNQNNALASQNAELAYSTALKNATLSQQTANLSALTTRNNAVTELNAKKQDAMHQPSTVHGQSSCDGANVAMNRTCFSIFQKCIQEEYAERIDNYFDVMGYAINAFEMPTIDNRTYYTYLQTQDSNVKPAGDGLDATTKATIDGIYNNGITTWKALAQVGDYSLAENNKPNTGVQY